MARPFEDHALRKARLCNVFKPDDPASMQILSGFHETFWHGGPIATAGAMICMWLQYWSIWILQIYYTPSLGQDIGDAYGFWKPLVPATKTAT